MNLTNNTVLVTGGSSGIGLQLSKVLVQKGNTVIICGRSEEKLARAKKAEPGLITYQCDLAQAKECSDLAKWIGANHPGLNVLVNNAAVVSTIDFLEEKDALAMAELEYQVNFFAPIRLIKLLYRTLKTNQAPTIVNVTTGLIYAPKVSYPFYNSSKAALHSFTQTLRMKLASENIQVIEVMFPAVDTPWHKGSPPKIAISTEAAVNEMVRGMQKGSAEIRVKGAKILYLLSRIAPGFALKKINQLP
jgi:uncharacterized oxidoreductase